jgi:hypothetical protein
VLTYTVGERVGIKTNPDMDVLLWVRSHLAPDAVIGSDGGNLLTLIPAIAGTWTFVPLGDRSMASNAEILTRYLLLCRVQGRTWQETETELTSDLGFKANSSSLGYILVMQRRLLPETVVAAKAIWSNIDLRGDFMNRRLDYLIVKQFDGVDGVHLLDEGFDTLYQNSKWRVVRIR